MNDFFFVFDPTPPKQDPQPLQLELPLEEPMPMEKKEEKEEPRFIIIELGD
jgi:hypothetical protein